MQQAIPRWRRGAAALALAGAVAAIVAAGAAADHDPNEPNDSAETAVQVPSSGERYQASLNGGADQDWYLVAAPGGDGFLRILASADSPDCDPPALQIRVLDDERRSLQSRRLPAAQGDVHGFEYRHRNTTAISAFFVVVDASAAPGCEQEVDYVLEAHVAPIAITVPQTAYTSRDCAFARADVNKRRRDVRRARAAVRRATTRRQRARSRRRLATARRRLGAARRVADEVCPGQ